jgi:hypothetical protein
MKTYTTFEFKDTEEEAKELCSWIRKHQSAYMNKHHAPRYTDWTSENGKEYKFVVWYEYRK